MDYRSSSPECLVAWRQYRRDTRLKPNIVDFVAGFNAAIKIMKIKSDHEHAEVENRLGDVRPGSRDVHNHPNSNTSTLFGNLVGTQDSGVGQSE